MNLKRKKKHLCQQMMINILAMKIFKMYLEILMKSELCHYFNMTVSEEIM